MKSDLRVGEIVRSRYRAPWRGVVLERLSNPPGCVLVRVTHDRRGRPIRKPARAKHVRRLHQWWLVRIDDPA
jgi:hypothetical protein